MLPRPAPLPHDPEFIFEHTWWIFKNLNNDRTVGIWTDTNDQISIYMCDVWVIQMLGLILTILPKLSN